MATATREFSLENGICIPNPRPSHRDDEYDEAGFDMLMRMQREHFWYRGRHKLLLNILKTEMAKNFRDAKGLRAIDMGGGCGGWIEYLHDREPGMFQQLALADSSIRALSLAEPVVGSFADRYQIDLLDLPWSEEWDVVFLLDVLEHIPDHGEVLRQIWNSLRPGGLLFITTPALKFFWTYNDDLVHHQRRYSRHDYRALSKESHFEVLRTNYFMFILSPALLLSRMISRPPKSATPEQLREHLMRTHRIPGKPVNELLTAIFSIEASVANFVSFPWGTSILAVLKK
ncbi:MAG: class I SAM-dependent methyltransferase [Planctomycetaceae bacterium]